MERTDNHDFNKLTSSVIKELKSISDKNITHPRYLPEKDAVMEIIEVLRNILFPGYFDKQSVEDTNIEYYIGALLFTARDKLHEQIYYALLHDNEATEKFREDADMRSEQITQEMVRKIPDLRRLLHTDVEATLEGDPAARNKHEIIFAYPGIYAISVYRIAHELHKMGVPLIPRMMTEHAHSITGIDIHPGAEIGHHFFIDHGTGIVIGETTEIGNHVKIYQGVTLGALSTRGGQRLSGKKRHPTLEDEVTVYSATSIFGGETVIGKGAVVGSNVFITSSVPPMTRVTIKSQELNFRPLKGCSE